MRWCSGSLDTMPLRLYSHRANLLLFAQRVWAAHLLLQAHAVFILGVNVCLYLGGGHHLLYSTVPDWMQTMGSIFSMVLILPSWGTAVNMLLTMKGQWHQLKESPMVKFLILASTFYMLTTLEGPIQSIKSVNALAHFTDWIIGHVHDAVLGWVGFTIMVATYHMLPRIFKREVCSK